MKLGHLSAEVAHSQVLRGSVYGLYLVITAAAVTGLLPWACALTQLGSIPTVPLSPLICMFSTEGVPSVHLHVVLLNMSTPERASCPPVLYQMRVIRTCLGCRLQPW